MLHEQLWSRLDEEGRQRGGEPWLFYPRRFDWRWLSWQEGLSAAEALGEGLQTEIGQRAEEVLLGDRAEVAVVLAWLAASRRGLSLGWQQDPAAPVARTLSWPRGPGEDDLSLELWVGDGASAGKSVPALEPCDLAIGEGASGREIVFFSGPPSAPEAERFVAWALLSGAALALEPHRPAALASAAWARPTVLWLGSEASLVEGLLSASGRLRRRLLSRLRVVVATELDPADRERLTAQGLELRLLSERDPERGGLP